MRFAFVILSAVLCLELNAQTISAETSDEALVAAAEQLISEGGRVEVAAVEPEKKELKESEIPVLVETKKEAKSESSFAWRLVLSFAVLIAIAGVLIFASKRWTKHKDKGGQKARIEILHQYHLGPRKSLALVRVSGEAILIGCTDQNINMLKSVTLIDDELEHIMNKDFNNFLEDEFSVEDVRSAISSRA